jgi:hypothetical protein
VFVVYLLPSGDARCVQTFVMHPVGLAAQVLV